MSHSNENQQYNRQDIDQLWSIDVVTSLLRHWPQGCDDVLSAGDSRLVQNELHSKSSLSEAVNSALLRGLDRMAIETEEQANVLRLRFLDKLSPQAAANRISIAPATLFRWQGVAIEKLATTLQGMERNERNCQQSKMQQRLESRSEMDLIGVAENLRRLSQQLHKPGAPWLLSIEGIGGIGKTTHANALAHNEIIHGSWHDLAWVTSRSAVFNPRGSIDQIEQPALTTDALIQELAKQLLPELVESASLPHQELKTALQKLLKAQPHLIFIDNLETVLDVKHLLPTLRSFANPSKIVITSRFSLSSEPDVYCFRVQELNEADTYHFLRQEATVRNLSYLADATDHELQPIWETAGGNPLALRLIVGLLHRHPLQHVLDDFKNASSGKTEALYTYIYRRAWDQLDESSRQLLITMPLVSGGGVNLEELSDMSGLSAAAVLHGLDELTRVSLVDCRGGLTEQTYTIHSLTRSFLLKQVVMWNQSA